MQQRQMAQKQKYYFKSKATAATSYDHNIHKSSGTFKASGTDSSMDSFSLTDDDVAEEEVTDASLMTYAGASSTSPIPKQWPGSNSQRVSQCT